MSGIRVAEGSAAGLGAVIGPRSGGDQVISFIGTSGGATEGTTHVGTISPGSRTGGGCGGGVGSSMVVTALKAAGGLAASTTIRIVIKPPMARACSPMTTRSISWRPVSTLDFSIVAALTLHLPEWLTQIRLCAGQWRLQAKQEEITSREGIVCMPGKNGRSMDGLRHTS